MPRQPIDWKRYRDQWVQRNLRGPAYSLKALAREESLSYGSLARKAREQSWRAQLEAERAALGERVAAEVRERTAIDQVEARLKHARIGDLVEPLLRDALQGLAHKVRGDPGALCVKDTVALGRLWTRLLEVGAGLQRGHDGAVQEVPEEVAANRRQMQELERAVMGLAEWKGRRRLQRGGETADSSRDGSRTFQKSEQ